MLLQGQQRLESWRLNSSDGVRPVLINSGGASRAGRVLPTEGGSNACLPGCTHAWCVAQRCQQPSCQWATNGDVDKDLPLLRQLRHIPHRAFTSPTGTALRVTAPVRDGFWVRVLHVMNQGLWASQLGHRFFVQHDDPADPYNAAGANSSGWEQYFEPVRKPRFL